MRPCLLASRVRSSRSRSWPSRERFCARCVTKKKPETVAVSEGGRRSGELCETGAPPAAVCSCAKCCVLCLSRRPLRTFGVAQEQTNGKAAGSLLRTVSHVGACPAGGLVVDSGQQSCGEWPSSPEPVRLTYIAITHLSLSSWLLILLVQWYGRADATQQVLGSNRESLEMEFF